MNKFLNFSFFNKVVFVVVFVNLVFFAFYILKGDAGKCDESLFITDLNLIKNKGWISAIEHQISIPYMLLAYPFSFFFKDYIALRIVNVLLFFLTLYYFKRNNVGKIFYLLFFFYVSSSVSVYFSGINDAVQDVALVVFFVESYFILTKERENYTLGLVALIIAIFTREVILCWFPFILFILFFVLKGKLNIKLNKVLLGAIILFFLVVNIPSILQNGKISYDNKKPPEDTASNWEQLQYLSQIMVEDGKLSQGQHPSFEETSQYLKKNGVNSLPSTTIESIFFDMKLTIKSFFRHLTYIFFYGGFRQMGLTIFIPFIFLWSYLKKRLDFIPIIFILGSLTTLCFFSVIIISNFELRWLIPVFILFCFLYDKKFNTIKKIKRFHILNVVCIGLLSLYGIYRIIEKL